MNNPTGSDNVQSSRYILYGGKPTRAMITQMVLAEGEIDYELRELDIYRDEHRSPEFLAINPAGWIPVLITPEGERLYETPGINLYLIETHHLDQLAPLPGDPQRGAFFNGLFYITGEIEPALKRLWYAHRYANGESDAEIVQKRAMDYIHECLNIIERHLANTGPYYLGERYSLVDLMTVYWSSSLGEPLSEQTYPCLCKLNMLVRTRPAITDLFEVHRQWELEDEH